MRAFAVTLVSSLVVAVLTLIPTSGARAGACAGTTGYTPGFALDAGARVAFGGGVLLMPTEGRIARGGGRGIFGRRIEATMTRGGRAVPFAREEIAPGWFLLRPEQVRAGRYTVRVGEARRRFTFATSGRAAALQAPRAPAVTYTPPHEYQGRGPGRGSRGTRRAPASNTLRLGAAPPAAAVGVIVVRQGTAHGFAVPVQRGGRQYGFSGYAGRCRRPPPGSVVSSGTTASVSFIDRHGRRSAAVDVAVTE